MSQKNSQAPLVTVYITNHNYGPYLEQAIESVLKQTLQDFELLVIDDGSTDNSREIISRYTAHPRIRTIFQENKGLNVTNNIALRAARGKYILRLDADDYLDEHALSVLSGVLEREPSVGLVFPDYFMVDEKGHAQELVRRHRFEEVELLDQPAHGACTLIRRTCLLELNGYDESFRCQDGYELWLRFIQHYKVKNVNLPLFYYRQHTRNLTKNDERILSTRGKILEAHGTRNGRTLTSVATIPVRGSAVDPNSLVLEHLGDKPLIDWTLDAALASKRLSGVVLTTPSDDLKEYVEGKYGSRVMVVKRDETLSRPNTHVDGAVFHALEEFGKSFPTPDVAVLLFAESPFRLPRYIDSAIDVLDFFQTDRVVSVRPDTDTFYRHQGKGLESIRSNSALRLEREELYREVGQIIAVRLSHLLKTRKIESGRVGHVVVDQLSGFQIRSELDWKLGQHLAREGREAHEF